jgi:hypothetical protein
MRVEFEAALESDQDEILEYYTLNGQLLQVCGASQKETESFAP